jgi:hypothetical protein
MHLNFRSGEVSFQVNNHLAFMTSTIRNINLVVNCVVVSDFDSCDLRESRGWFTGSKSDRKCQRAKGLDTLCPHTNSARLARLREVKVFGLTSPQKTSETLGFYAEARLARLFPPMLTCTHAYVRTRVINNFAYRSGLKITSLNLANLASGFASARTKISLASKHRTTLRTDARSLASRPTRRPSHSWRQWANSGPVRVTATVALTLSRRTSANGSSQKNNPSEGRRETSR